jgi:hypothetical protein
LKIVAWYIREKMRNEYKILLGKPEVTIPLGIDGRKILKWMNIWVV